MLAIALWSSAVILALLVAVVSLPMRIRLLARSEPQRRLQVEVVPFAGAAPSLRVVDSSRRKTKPKRKKKKKPRGSKRKKSGGMLRWIGGLPTLMIELLGKFKVHHIVADGRFGFEDPADTGVVFGMLAPLVYGLPPSSRVQLRVRPVFGEPLLAGEIDAAIEVTPVTLLPPVVRYAWRKFGSNR